MKKLIFAFFLVIVAAIGVLSISSADNTSSMTAAMAPTIVTPSSLKWTPITGVAGAWQATVWGDPTKTGLFVVRLKLADGTKVPAHWHTNTERVTVLSGTLMVGVGDSNDAAKMMSLGPGTFAVMPAKVHHYAMAKGDTIVQIGGEGPETMDMVKQ